MKKILIHPEIKKILAKEFNTSYTTITMSIDGVFTSPKALAIRERAKQLLQDEVNKIENAQNQ